MAESTQPKNVHQRLQEVRYQLTTLELKKTGQNSHTKKNYYELGDFMPAINKLNFEHGLTTHFNIYPAKNGNKEVAILVVCASEKPEDKMVWKTNTAEVALQGGQAIQNLGGKHTYMRRYMFMGAYEISEGDAVDAQELVETVGLDPISMGKIDKAKTHDELVDVCSTLKKELGAEYQKPLVAYYTKRKNELAKDTTNESA